MNLMEAQVFFFAWPYIGNKLHVLVIRLTNYKVNLWPNL